MQLYNSLRVVDIWPPSDLATCRAVTAGLIRDGMYDRVIDDLAERKRNLYATNSVRPDYKGVFIAEVAIRLAPKRRFLGFGSYVCIVPMAIRRRIGEGLFHAVDGARS